ncbi:ester cyclase [Undibacterium terreum]|uniref:Ester cyclase n=1 Tax=Undibacterium terreum TaxID=1224302 RepID=A0A916XKM3_9BURK|nr:ester cyclase [Undibacterium terreum]GGC81539.1 hypothetical protein GCM10011396_30960 [Undibacterium terreum]
MLEYPSGDTAKALVRRSIHELLNEGEFASFNELFAPDFIDHTPQGDFVDDQKPGDRKAIRAWYQSLRHAFPDLRVEVHWQLEIAAMVTTYSRFQGTHLGVFLGVEATDKRLRFDSVDVIRVQDHKIKEHWGLVNLHSLGKQLTVNISTRRHRKAYADLVRDSLIKEIIGG